MGEGQDGGGNVNRRSPARGVAPPVQLLAWLPRLLSCSTLVTATPLGARPRFPPSSTPRPTTSFQIRNPNSEVIPPFHHADLHFDNCKTQNPPRPPPFFSR